MEWVYLIGAGILEIGWALGMKFSENFTKPVPTIATIILLIMSFALLQMAIRTIPLGTAYAIWTGIGAAGTAIISMILFKESADIARILCIMLIVAGVVGLKLVSPEH